MRHVLDKLLVFDKDFPAFRVGQVRHLTSAEFAFLFMISNSYVQSFYDCYLTSAHMLPRQHAYYFFYHFWPI